LTSRLTCLTTTALVIVLSLTIALAPSPVFAQGAAPAAPGAEAGEDGYVRIQGRRIPKSAADAPASTEILLDLREEMRKLVIGLARFSRKQRRNFRIVARGGLDLLVKRDDVDETKTSPARTYMRSLDGILAEGLFFTEKKPGLPPPPDKQRHLLKMADVAKRYGIKVFTLDYGIGNEIIDKGHELAAARGYISLVSDRPLLDIAKLPAYPKRPFNENAGSVLTLGDVKNFAVITNSLGFGREDRFALAVHGTNYDMVIVDVFHGRKAFSRQAVETLKYKKVGAKRLVLATMDIGTAASYRYYWKDNWREGSPPWIAAPVRGDADRYNVEFWRPGWKKIISGGFKSYIYGVIAQGFDGVLLDGLEAYRHFEGDGENTDEDN